MTGLIGMGPGGTMIQMKPIGKRNVSARIASALAAHGLVVFGVTEARPEDMLPDLAPGRPARAIALVGNAGSDFWPVFTASDEYADGEPHPLNRWSTRVLQAIAADHGTRAVFPFEGPPYWPFQRWATRTGTMSQSPVGVLVDRRYGPWFAFRGAFVLPEPVPVLEDHDGGPCESCAEKPCLDACPAGALTRQSAFQVDICRTHVTGAGAQVCGATGCQVRHACPVGREFSYRPEQAALHMASFISLR